MTTLVDIIIPTDQREGTESKIGRWLKQEGDGVSENEPILEVHTDKVTLEVAAPVSGILRTILKREGEIIDLTEPLGRIEPSGIAVPTTPEKAAPSGSPPADRELATNLSPAVRSLAKELGVDPGAVRGTGKDGRVTAKDIERAGKEGGSRSSGSKRRAHSPMRKSIAARMSESVAKAPHVTSVFEADFTAVLSDKAKRGEEFSASGVKLTMTAYLVRAAAQALRAVPEVNSRWHDEYLELLDEVAIGFAAAIDDPQGEGAGLVVPVIRRVDSLSLLQIATEVQRLTAAARSGTLKSEDLTGGTFTISNHGTSGSLLATPILIPQPQTAILGVGKLERRPFVTGEGDEEKLAIRSAAYVTLTVDHRAIDGFTANRFLTALVAELALPSKD